jgi:beta-lactamase superfamily II metal-dependent hydrolase
MRVIERRGGFAMRGLWLAIVGCGLASGLARAGETDQRLDIYFVDVEGGAATLIVTPAGESVLIDSGYPDFGGRDRDRILKVVQHAGLKQIDHAVVSHWHLDHYGNHAALAAKITIGQFWDRGIPDALQEDPKFGERIAAYRAAAQNQSKPLKVGDALPLKAGKTPLTMKIVVASGEVLPNEGEANRYAYLHVPQAEDPTDNAKSIGSLLAFGKFKFLTCGDLTWNIEAKLTTPNNPLGKVDLFMVTHHGLSSSNNPVLVRAIDPRVAVICNGPTKGANPETLATLRSVTSLLAWYQLHRNVQLDEFSQTPAAFIANQEDVGACRGVWIKASVEPDAAGYTVQIGPNGKSTRYAVR